MSLQAEANRSFILTRSFVYEERDLQRGGERESLGFFVVCFPSSGLHFWFSALAFFLRLRSLAG